LYCYIETNLNVCLLLLIQLIDKVYCVMYFYSYILKMFGLYIITLKLKDYFNLV